MTDPTPNDDLLELTPREAAARIRALEAEIERRKGDPITRLHNLCEALAKDKDDSPYSAEAWEAQDEAYREKCAELRAAEARAQAAEADGTRTYDSLQGEMRGRLDAEARVQTLETALRELVACKDLKDRIDAYEKRPNKRVRSSVIRAEIGDYRIEYESRKTLAWKAARAALAATQGQQK